MIKILPGISTVHPGRDLELNSNAIFLKKHAGLFLLACFFLSVYSVDKFL
jgi:hypothetical protein